MTKQTRKALGKRMRELRIAKGWTLEYLANIAHSTYSYVSDIENGKVNWKIDTIGRILKALGAKTGNLEIIII